LERTTALAGATRTIEDRAGQQASVAKLGAKALSGMPPSTLIEDAASTIVSILGVDFCSIRELTPYHENLVLRGTAGWPKEVQLDRLRAGTRSQSGFNILNGTPVVVEDMDSEPRFEISPLVRSSGCRSSSSVTGEESLFLRSQIPYSPKKFLSSLYTAFHQNMALRNQSKATKSQSPFPPFV
jgi:hypothetical protein